MPQFGRFHKQIAIRKQVDLPYLLHLPEIESTPAAGWPLLLFLHGRDQRGDDPARLLLRGLPKIAAADNRFPFVVLAPQCPVHYIWPFVFDGVMALLNETAARYPVDRQRIFVTGLSMGGYAAWDLAMEYPMQFAGIVPVCGSASKERISLLRPVPVWAFHGARDETVPLQEAEELIAALKACGGEGKLTIYPQGGHDIWEQAYRTGELYTHFFQRSLHGRSTGNPRVDP